MSEGDAIAVAGCHSSQGNVREHAARSLRVASGATLAKGHPAMIDPQSLAAAMMLASAGLLLLRSTRARAT